jgi:hypothetical protein
MVHNWRKFLENHGDENGKCLLAMEKYKTELFFQDQDQDDYDAYLRITNSNYLDENKMESKTKRCYAVLNYL